MRACLSSPPLPCVCLHPFLSPPHSSPFFFLSLSLPTPFLPLFLHLFSSHGPKGEEKSQERVLLSPTGLTSSPAISLLICSGRFLPLQEQRAFKQVEVIGGLIFIGPSGICSASSGQRSAVSKVTPNSDNVMPGRSH